MDTHPSRPVHSLRDFSYELLVVTAGILIALSFDGIVSWQHHRNLVKEAQANLRTEIQENNAELQRTVTEIQRTQKQLRDILDLIHWLKKDRSTHPESASVTWTIAQLHSASWSTASTTGAMAFMPYAQVKRYSEVYDLQQQFNLVQDRAFQSSLQVIGLLPVTFMDPKTISATQLSDAEKTVTLAAANVNAVIQLAAALQSEYAKALQ